MVVSPIALGARHPVRYGETASSRHAASRRPVAQATTPRITKPGARSGKSSAPKPKAGTAAHSTKPLAKAKPHRRHREAEADNDPPVIYRTGAHSRRSVRREKSVQAVATSQEPASGTDDSSDDLLAISEAVTADDFKRAPAATAAQAPANAASRPDDDRPATSTSQQVVATAEAAPGRVAPAPARGRSKTSPLPEDHAGRAALVEEMIQPVVLRPLYTRNGRLIVPPPMKGSRDILVHQNTMADSEGLDRIQDDADLDRMRAAHLLVPLSSSAAMEVNEGLPENRRYARPWTERFAVDTARAFYARFHQPLHLNSAVRTVEYQLRLQMVNGNAAAVDGDAASPHLTGQALDFGKHGMSVVQIAWMRAYLGPLMEAGKVDVEEEFQQACFHISVYRSYAPILKPKAKTVPKVEVAQTDAPAHAALKTEALR
jgi:hypothetical protein